MNATTEINQASAPAPTLREFLAAQKVRKGKATGITSEGAFWDALNVKIGSYGGDGIGQNSCSHSLFFRVRHYRNGDMTAHVCDHSWHQNYGANNQLYFCPAALDCTDQEQVETILKAVKNEDWNELVLSSRAFDGLDIPGFPKAPPAPDEA